MRKHKHNTKKYLIKSFRNISDKNTVTEEWENVIPALRKRIGKNYNADTFLVVLTLLLDLMKETVAHSVLAVTCLEEGDKPCLPNGLVKNLEKGSLKNSTKKRGGLSKITLTKKKLTSIKKN